MSSWISAILLILIIIVAGLFILKRQNKLPSFLSNIIKSSQTIEQLNTLTEQENTKTLELRTLLEAKQKLAKAKAVNSALRKQINNTAESTIPLAQVRASLENKDASKEKA